MSELFGPQMVMLIGQVGIWQILLIVLAVVLLFGAGKIPRLMRDMGQGINAFKSGLKESKSDDAEGEDEDGEVEKPKALEDDPKTEPTKARRKTTKATQN